MEFSKVVACDSARPPLFSPCGNYLAIGLKNKLIIRRVDDLSKTREQQCKDAVEYIEWSSDSLYIITANFRRGLVEVWAMEDPEWSCRMDESAAGLDSVRWAPDGRHVISTAEFQLRITVWSLVSHRVFFFKFPKHSGRGLSFSNDGKYMAVLECKEQKKDRVCVVSCKDWKIVRQFNTDTTDAYDLKWSPDDHFLCVWDSCLRYNVCVYNFLGEKVKSFSAYEGALGVKSVEWSPSSQLLAIGSYDKSVRILNNMTWSQVIDLKHKTSVSPSSKRFVYEEVPTNTSESAARRIQSEATTKYNICEEMITLPSRKPNPEKANPQLGVGWMKFSCNTQYLASRTDNSPHALYIWHITKLRLVAVLKHLHTLHDAAWHPRVPLLAMCCGGSQLYFWSKKGTYVVKIPAPGSFYASSIKWTVDGDAIILAGKKGFCTCSCSNFEDM
eukprot:m.45748 g.45748  ORF g.45748 m.45748 type:complete len:443 (-) comp10690_c0_seq3:103-1431(-)